jgi:hypothetical protein
MVIIWRYGSNYKVQERKKGETKKEGMEQNGGEGVHHHPPCKNYIEQ